MQQQFRKIKRVQPIIKLKKAKVDEEAAILTRIRHEKVQIVAEMKESQRKYMAGVEELNKVRASAVRMNLETLEHSLDHVKEHIYKLFKEAQKIERKEKEQIEQLLVAERELKSVEKLRERYETEFHKELKKNDQKLQDDVAMRKFSAGE